MQNDAAPPDVPPVALVGAGAVGTVLGRSLSANGGQVAAVLSRSEGSAQSLADRVGAPTAGALGETPLPADVELFFLCVPDDAIAEVATALAAAPHSWPNAIVAHTSGAKTASVLAPLAQEGAATMSFHPLQTCTETTAPDALDGIVVGLEGDGRALTVGERVARLIGAQPVQLTPTEKARYHAAAVLASNGLVALLAVVEELFGSLDSSPSDRL